MDGGLARILRRSGGRRLDRLGIACERNENLMPVILDAVRAYATLGEMIGVMKEAFGVYEEPMVI